MITSLVGRQRRLQLSKNIVIISSNKDFRQDLSKILARDMKKLYIDADELLDFEILNRQELIGIKEAGEMLKHVEQDYINRITNFKNCIITMSDQLFLANDNFELLKGLKKIYLPSTPQSTKGKSYARYKMEQELLMYDDINKLLRSLCDITINPDSNLQRLSQNIIYELENA